MQIAKKVLLCITSTTHNSCACGRRLRNNVITKIHSNHYTQTRNHNCHLIMPEVLMFHLYYYLVILVDQISCVPVIYSIMPQPLCLHHANRMLVIGHLVTTDHKRISPRKLPGPRNIIIKFIICKNARPGFFSCLWNNQNQH